MKTYSYDEISNILNYRSPLAMLDSATELSENRWTGLKNISFNDVVFNGHFPNHPILPGVMQVEAMEQLAELSLKNILNPNSDKLLLAKKMRKVKFRKPALPGDRLMLELEIKNISGEEAEVSVVSKTNSGIISQAEIHMGLFPKKRNEVKVEVLGEWDKNDNIAMDANKIMSIIPHRYPFLFVDYVIKMETTKLIAVKNVTASEPFCGAHSANVPTVPVPFMSEIVAQAGCVLALSRPSNQGKLAYFMAIDETECLEPARPGDQLRIEVDVPECSSRFGKGEGRLSIGERLISRTMMTFAVVGK